MKNIYQMLALFMVSFLIVSPSFAQEDSPADALDKINVQISQVNQKYMAYMSEVAHGTKIKKAEKKHAAFMEQIDNSRYALASIPYYKGDKSLHEGTKSYLQLITNLQRENYSKVINLEEIAEQSYDAMEAYLLFKRKINERMDLAADERKTMIETYCTKHNITLVEAKETEEGSKMKKLDAVMDYKEMMFLIFFKASVHEDQLIEAMNKKNITAMEQIRSTITKYSDEGLQKLDTIKRYNGSDATLKLALKRTLDFFKKEAELLDAFTDFQMKEETFNAVKKAFEKNSRAQSDKKEIDKYNAAINEMNKSSEKLNQVNQQLNKNRTETYKNWNEANKRFLDTHVPYSK
jgi:hypothetical protein